MEIRVRWKGLDKETLTPPGVRLSYLLTKEGIDFPLPCGGEGVCGRCKVRFLVNPPPPTPAEERLLTPEELESGVRLACCAVVTQDTEVELLGGEAVLPREFFWDLEKVLPRIHPLGKGERAAALDLGTTTLVLSHLDLKKATRLATRAMVNPQRSWGDDVVSRMRAVLEGQGEALSRAVWEAVLPHLEGASYLVVAGNSVMETILAGLPVDTLARYPFQPPFGGGQWRDDPFPHYLMPLVGGFLGGDTAALLLVLDLIKARKPALVMDLGTNAEILLLTSKGVRAASAPAGPALEGMGVSSGVGLSPGAVVKVEKAGDELVFHTLDGSPPRGFSGSGILSFMALLLREGVVDASGRMKEKGELSLFWKERRNEKGLLLDNGLTFTQEDVRKIQLAKGAVASAWRTLLTLEDEEEGPEILYLAGAFGSALDLEDLKILGLVPHNVVEACSLGNASLVGAEAVALSRECLERVESLVKMVEVVDLASQDGYQDIYMASLSFGDG